MNGKQIKICIISGVMALTFAGTAWSGERHNDPKRFQSHQINRIYNGVQNGEITAKEYRKLNREQQQIHRARQKAVSDGKITRNERKRLSNLREKAGRHIYAATHNHHQRHHDKYEGDHGYRPKYKSHDDHYLPYYRNNSFSIAGSWVDPNWGFSFYSSDQCRR